MVRRADVLATVHNFRSLPTDRVKVPATMSRDTSAAIAAIVAKQPAPFDSDDYREALTLLQVTRVARKPVAAMGVRVRPDGLVAGSIEAVEAMREAAELGVCLWQTEEMAEADCEEIDETTMIACIRNSEAMSAHPLAFGG